MGVLGENLGRKLVLLEELQVWASRHHGLNMGEALEEPCGAEVGAQDATSWETPLACCVCCNSPQLVSIGGLQAFGD